MWCGLDPAEPLCLGQKNYYAEPQSFASRRAEARGGGWKGGDEGLARDRCRANMAHIRQSRSDSGLGFQAKGLKRFEWFPLRSEETRAPREKRDWPPLSDGTS